MIPLARVLPRIIRKLKENGVGSEGPMSQNNTAGKSNGSSTQDWNIRSTAAQSPPPQKPTESTVSPPPPRPRQQRGNTQSNDILVLGQMIAGAKTFESIQKYTGLSAQKLDPILQDLESRELIKVVHKQGLLGQKVEIYPTSKGMREFHR